MEFNDVVYKAGVQYEDGYTTYPVVLMDFNEDLLDKELWVNKSWGDRGVVKINDANIPEKDLYYLGYLKVVRIDKVETFVNTSKIY